MNDVDRKHQENLRNFKEIKDIFTDHEKKDMDFQLVVSKQFDRMEKWFERAEPMVKIFENKKVAKMVFDEETRTLTFYIKTLTTWGIFLAGIWTLIKYIFLKN